MHFIFASFFLILNIKRYTHIIYLFNLITKIFNKIFNYKNGFFKAIIKIAISANNLFFLFIYCFYYIRNIVEIAYKEIERRVKIICFIGTYFIINNFLISLLIFIDNFWYIFAIKKLV